MEWFRQAVKTRLEWLKLDQSDLASIIGITSAPLSRLLQDPTNARPETVSRVLWALGLVDIELGNPWLFLTFSEKDPSLLLAHHPADRERGPWSMKKDPKTRYKIWFSSTWKEKLASASSSKKQSERRPAA